MDSTSRWFVGSSRASRFEPWRVMRARATRTRSPPERASVFRFISSPLKPKRPR
jgi:hypothetical protein